MKAEVTKKPIFKKVSSTISGQMRYYGVHACLRIFQERAADIIKVYVVEERVKTFGALLKWCAQNKKSYRIIAHDQLARITESVHHEGVCIVAKEKASISFERWFSQIEKDKQPMSCLYLDGVQDPHNLGAIIRTAAHFGVKYIFGDVALLPRLSPSAYRIAKGAAEVVSLVTLSDVSKALAQLKKAGFSLISATQDAKHSLYDTEFSSRNVFVFGAEDVGIRPKVRTICDKELQIPGANQIESLNVATAIGVVLGEVWRQLRN